MEADIHRLVQTIHDAPPRIVLVTAGAGTKALADLLGVAGASRTLSEAIVPYGAPAFDDFLGQTPTKYVAGKTANLLAGRAYTRARWLEHENLPNIGLACTATIITDRPKRGEHRAYIATWQPDKLVQYAIFLEKGARDRTGEEDVVSRIMLNALAYGMGLEKQLKVPLDSEDRFDSIETDFRATAVALHNRELDFFGVTQDGRIRRQNVNPQAILSGAFNPLHDGHIDLLRTAEDILGHPVAFECSAVNVDKPPIPPETTIDRVSQFAGRYPVYITNAPTYIEKARLFPGTVFVVGYDTAVRVLQPRYYQNSEDAMLAALAEIRELGCSFLVGGRQDGDGVFRDVDALAIPADFQNLFHGIPAERFRKDISSTELRATGRRGSR